MNMVALILQLLLCCWTLTMLLQDLLLTGIVVLCKPSSTCSLSQCMVWTAQWMVLEAGDLITDLFPPVGSLLFPGMCFCSLWDAEKQMASWKQDRVSLAGYLTWWRVPHIAAGGQAKRNGAGEAVHQGHVRFWQNTCSADVPDPELHPLTQQWSCSASLGVIGLGRSWLPEWWDLTGGMQMERN